MSAEPPIIDQAQLSGIISERPQNFAWFLGAGASTRDLRFWREGERTEFEVLTGDASFIERCEAGAKHQELLARSRPPR
jgi:hypothetical protein